MKADGEVDNGRSNLDKVLNKHLLMNKLKKQKNLFELNWIVTKPKPN